MGIGNQLAIQVQHACALVSAKPQRLDAELHAEVAALIEERFADEVCPLQLFEYIAANQRVPLLAGLQGFTVVLQEDLQVLIVELLQPPLRPEERLKVIQRGIGAFTTKG